MNTNTDTFTPSNADVELQNCYMSRTKDYCRLYLPRDEAEYVRMMFECEDGDPLTFKVVRETETYFELVGQRTAAVRYSGFKALTLNGAPSTNESVIELCVKFKDFFSKTPTKAFVRYDGVPLNKRRVFVQKPRPEERMDYNTARRYAKQKTTRQPDVVARPALTAPERGSARPSLTPASRLNGFTKVSETVTYRCDFTGETMQFANDAEAHKAMGRRSDVYGFCTRHDLKFDMNAAWVRALLVDEHITF